MALIISLNPNISTWSIGDPSPVVSFSGGNTGTGDMYLWESDNGSFANKFDGGTTFTPKNATKITSITARRVWRINYGSYADVAASGTGPSTMARTQGGEDWNAWIHLNTASSNGTFGWFEFEASETNTERAAGFLSNGAFRDPTIINSDIDSTFSYSFHLYKNSTVIARRGGIALTSPLFYKTGDIFRVVLEATTVNYYINGILVASATRATGNPQYPTMSFYTANSTLVNWSYQQDPDNSGTSFLNVVGVLPINPNYAYELTNDNITATSMAEDGAMFFRKRGNAKKGFSLSFNQRPFTEYDTLAKFWQAHERQEKFIYRDIPNSQSFMVRFESGLQTTIESPDVISIQASLKEI
jgi:hypothetical protein